MKKNNFYSALAAAVFLLAVGCTDDIEKGVNGTETPQENGEKVYVTVNVSSPLSGTTTKAPAEDDTDTDHNPGSGELGDGTLEDMERESKVHDINIYLVKVKSPLTSNDLLLINKKTVSELPIEGKAYHILTSDEQLAGGGSVAYHDAKATIEISIPDPIYNTYQVFAVVNAGKKLEFTNLSQLRDYLQEKAWTGTDPYDVEKCTNFVMSTHMMYDKNGGPSTLAFEPKHTNPNTPAVTSVYVERLAARIDMNFANGLTMKPKSRENDQVTIEGYSIVNQLQAGSYMIKRVSPSVSDPVTGMIPEVTTDYPTGEYKYLGDELWSETLSKYNYVLDPWTRNKNTDGFTNGVLHEGTYYTGTSSISSQEPSTTTLTDLYANWFTQVKDGYNLNTEIEFQSTENISTTDNNYTPVLYTLENTTNVTQQKHGYSTGVIFKGTYIPAEYSEYTYTNSKAEVKVIKNENKNVTSFYIVKGLTDNNHANYLCADLKTIGALILSTAGEKRATQGVMNAVMQGAWSENTDVTLASIKAVADGILESTKLARLFKAYLKGICEQEGVAWNTETQSKLTWNAFVNKQNGLKAPTTVAESEVLKSEYEVSFYDKGVNYYKFWIRHQTNNNPNVMGVMEFGIVRNNVYMLQITAVNGLGDPLPFTPKDDDGDGDDPDDPDEDDKVKIQVNIYVKDWVKRTNPNIIL